MKRGFVKDLSAAIIAATAVLYGSGAHADAKKIAYLTPSADISFWSYVATGVKAGAKSAGIDFVMLDSHNDDAVQLKNAEDAIAKGVSGIVLSPTSSAAAPAVLALAEKAGIPVVICDVGTSAGTYTSFVASDNLRGSRGVGQAAATEVQQRGWSSGSFGIIGIPQARKNGQLRSEGFRAAMKGTAVSTEVPLREMKTFTADESRDFAAEMLKASPDLHVIFVQSDEQAMGAAAAVAAAHREKDVLVAAFDGTPELLKAIVDGKIVGAGMQQPYLMGSVATKHLATALAGGTPPKLEMVPILTVTGSNVAERMDQIKTNVFANQI